MVGVASFFKPSMLLGYLSFFGEFRVMSSNNSNRVSDPAALNLAMAAKAKAESGTNYHDQILQVEGILKGDSEMRTYGVKYYAPSDGGSPMLTLQKLHRDARPNRTGRWEKVVLGDAPSSKIATEIEGCWYFSKNPIKLWLDQVSRVSWEVVQEKYPNHLLCTLTTYGEECNVDG
jgi:hypothetical protein